MTLAYVKNGTSILPMAGDASGRPLVVVEGNAAEGAAIAGAPVLMGGSDPSGNARAMATDYAGNQSLTFAPSHLGPFGDLIASELTPLFQKAFTIGVLDPQLESTSVSGTGAAIDVNANRLRLQCGTDAAGTATYQSTQIAQYRAGQGFIFEWTCTADTGVADSNQIAGFGSASDGIFVGRNGTSYGILYRNAGVDTWFSQASWSGDKCNGAGKSGFDMTHANLNVFRATVPYLGAGAIRVFVMAPRGDWLLAHTIEYPSSSPNVEFSDPAFRFYARVWSVTSTTNLTMYIGSYAAFLVGKKGTRGRLSNFTSRKSVTSEVALFSIKNATTVNGDPNNKSFTIRWINGSNDGANSDARFRFVLGATLGGTPAFAPKHGSTADNGDTLTNAASVLSVDTAGTTVTGGEEVFTITMARNSTTTPVDVSSEDFQLGPGQVLTISAQSLAGGSQACAFTVTGRED